MPKVYVALIGCAAVVGIAVGVVLHTSFATSRAQAKPALPALYGEATWKAGASHAPDFALRDQRGHRVALDSFRGRTVVLAFMDSLCKSECPIQGRQFAAAIRSVAPAARPQLVIVSVDLADTPASAAKAVRKWHLPAGTVWLLGTHAELAPVWHAYDIFVKPVDGDVVHSDAFYVLDRSGDRRAGFIAPFEPGLLAYDLRKLAV